MQLSKSVVVFGATGLIGRELVQMLIAYNYNVVVVTRDREKAQIAFGNSCRVEEVNDFSNIQPIIDGSYAVINLAGENIATIWTKKNKKRILNSRVNISKSIAQAINECHTPPNVLIQGSAVGYYNHNSDSELNEFSTRGIGFLSDVVEKWENSVKGISKNTRKVFLRTGVVLSTKGGFLEKLLVPTKFFVGGWFGDGTQFMPWIHIHDHIRSILFLLESNKSEGVYNLVSPNPLSQKLLVKTLGKFLSRPVFIKIPRSPMKLILGEMVDEVLLSNQNVKPERLLVEGFKFKFVDIDQALADLLSSK